MADDVDELIAELAALGTDRKRAIYRRHGAREPIFGVGYKDFGIAWPDPPPAGRTMSERDASYPAL